MTNSWRSRAAETQLIGSRGIVEWGIKSGGRFLKTYRSGGKTIAVGKPGANYEIWVKNRSKAPVEVVASVDGLDVIDGRPASTKKNGYIIEPGQTTSIRGFRTSYESLALFKFSSVANSYSNQKHGTTRNVGVIGLALYLPKNQDPWTWMPREIRDRKNAQPFASAP